MLQTLLLHNSCTLKPKNAIIRQYQKIFQMEGVKLEFTREALAAIARKSIEKNQLDFHSQVIGV